MNRARLWLAPLLALTASSPFWLGEDTGYASFRTEIWSRWPIVVECMERGVIDIGRLLLGLPTLTLFLAPSGKLYVKLQRVFEQL